MNASIMNTQIFHWIKFDTKVISEFGNKRFFDTYHFLLKFYRNKSLNLTSPLIFYLFKTFSE